MFGGTPFSIKRSATLRISAILLMVAVFPSISERSAFADEVDLWAALKDGGHIALLRHAMAPGTGDPENFVIGDCSTQRNLSVSGRAQAKRIGERFRANGMERARVFSSQWCRCFDTARGLMLGPVMKLPPLNSFFQRSEKRKPQTKALKAWLNEQNFFQTHVLVTHQVNITALTGVYPNSGELVIVRRSKDGSLTVIGTIETE